MARGRGQDMLAQLTQQLAPTRHVFLTEQFAGHQLHPHQPVQLGAAAHTGEPADHLNVRFRRTRRRLQRQRIFQRLIPQQQLLTEALQLPTQRLNQLGQRQLTKTGQRQAATLLQAAGLFNQQCLPVILQVGLLHLLQQPLAELVLLQTVERKGLVVFGIALLFLQPDFQPGGKEVLDRIAQKALQRQQLDGGFQRDRRQRLVCIIASPGVVQLTPLARVAEQRGVGAEIGAAEGLQRMLDGQRVQQI